jgi:hypothetical protein
MTVAQVCPGLKLTRTIWFSGNRPVWSWQKPMVDEKPFCMNVTNVTCTVPPIPFMTLPICTKLTEPVIVEPVLIAPRTKTSPQPLEVPRSEIIRTGAKMRFTNHPAVRIYPCLSGKPSRKKYHFRPEQLSTALPARVCALNLGLSFRKRSRSS